MTDQGAAAFFYDEWRRRGPGDRRDLRRAARLLGVLAVPALPTLTVVGSKGKGTTATYASAWSVAAGRRVVTVTSPGLRGDTDRIRLDGVAISEEDLAALARRLREAAASASSATPLRRSPRRRPRSPRPAPGPSCRSPRLPTWPPPSTRRSGPASAAQSK
jgi:folylpolyglutamate synthase/dihydropteroate synthase